jgi:hypothetical protein
VKEKIVQGIKICIYILFFLMVYIAHSWFINYYMVMILFVWLVVQNSRKRTSTQLDAANDGPSSNGEPGNSICLNPAWN